MKLINFSSKFPDIGIEGFRFSLEEDLLEGIYWVVESYCDNPECDCQDVHLSVLSPDNKKVYHYYFDWSNKNNILEIGDDNTEPVDYVQYLFSKLQEKFNKNDNYIKSLKLHYSMIKNIKIDEDNKMKKIERVKFNDKVQKERNKKKLAKKQRQRNRKK